MTGCASDAARRLAEAERAKAEASIVSEALKPTPLPDLPPDCRTKEYSGARLGDRFDTALFKAEDALWRTRQRTARCAAFYDQVKAGRAAK